MTTYKFVPLVQMKLLSELEFLKSVWGLGTEEEEGYSTGPPGYIGSRNSFLGIDSGAPYTFKIRAFCHPFRLWLILYKPQGPYTELLISV